MTRSVYDIRRDNLVRLTSERGAKTALAIRLEVTQSRITHMLDGTRQIHEDVARRVEDVMGLAKGELDIELGVTPAKIVDSKLLEDSVRAVISAAAEAHAKLVADKTAGIVRLVYDHSVAMGRVDPAFVAQLVKLMR